MHVYKCVTVPIFSSVRIRFVTEACKILFADHSSKNSYFVYLTAERNRQGRTEGKGMLGTY